MPRSKSAPPDAPPPLPPESDDDSGTGRLVVVGASAGGIEALSTLVGSLPAGFPAPVVLAQHLDPGRPSHLDNILRQRGALPVVLVDETARLEPGTVYVVPANRHVAILDGHVSVETEAQDRPRPSIDLLLTTAAQHYGDGLIAVILTGSGSDGANGAVAVHSAGGTVIIQNPASAAYPSMPLAVPPPVVDHVTDLDGLAGLLNDLLGREALPAPPPGPDDPLAAILALVSRQADIDFRPYKPTTIRRRLARRMVATHSATLDDYLAYLESHPDEVGDLVMAFLIKVTEFFRDPDAFGYLRSTVLPAILQKSRARDRVLRFWSAGCATGEEAYSLALLLADLLGSELNEWSIRIFATDLDENAIAFARRGIYPPGLLEHLPDNYLARFFENVGGQFRLAKHLRQLVIFGQQDLSRGVPFPRIDLVVCRNVLIYFQPDLQQNVLDMFAYSLQQTAGYLFLGQAETVRPAKTSFDLIAKRWKFYRCVSGPLPRFARHPAPPLALPSIQPSRSAFAAAAPPPAVFEAETTAAEAEIQNLRRFSEWVLRFLPGGVVVVDRGYHIVTANPSARRLLAIRDVSSDQDFLHAVRGLPYSELRDSIDRLFRDRATIVLRDMRLDTMISNEERYLTLSLVLMHIDANQPDLAVISVADTTEQVLTERRLQAAQAEQKGILDELSAVNGRLTEMNKELQDVNEQLQATNEEMMLTQEELQATNEEFEATNEELQATNEELETNIEELQATNEELETTNEELQARTGELGNFALSLADEQARLHSVIAHAPFFAMLLRGPALIVEMLSAQHIQLLADHDPIGRSFAELFPDNADLLRALREIYQQNPPATVGLVLPPLPGLDKATAAPRFRYHLIPTHDSRQRVDGIVLYAEDSPA